MKAALLSALVFPGAGHIFLKKYIVGGTLACASLLSLYCVISTEVERALQVVEKIQRGEVQPNLAAITDMISMQAMGTDTRLLNIVSILLLFFWVIGIVDSYLAGREKNKADAASAE